MADYITAVPVAALAPALLAALLARSAELLPVAFGVALAHMAILALPLFLALQWKRWLNAVTATAAGFVIGAVPLGYWVSVDPVINGTAAVWTFDPVIACLAPLLAPGWIPYLKLLGLLGVPVQWAVSR